MASCLDIEKGEIYMVTNKVTNKSYIGQAPKFMGCNNQSWGASGRWKRHIRDSKKTQEKNLFKEAIREFGEQNFELKVICECDRSEMDALEQKYIAEYQTMEPNGYNMTTGGRKGTKHSEEANRRKLNRNRNLSEEAKKNISVAQIGKRCETTSRKREEDNELPKNITPIRKEGVIVGYQVKKFPMGIEKPEYIYKTFKNKYNTEKALEDAKLYVDFLKKAYQTKLDDYKKHKESLTTLSEEDTMMLPKLPDYVYPIMVDKRLHGYYVYGMKDMNGFNVPRREFTSQTNSTNLNRCIRFIKTVQHYNENLKIVPEDWLSIELLNNTSDTHVPKYIRETRYNGEITGYRVDFVKVIEGKTIKEYKSFTKSKLSLEEKLDLAKKYVAELEAKYMQNSNN
jgi:group I intron endonuclease